MDTAGTDELLTTTRAVRKRLDLARPVEPELLRECIEIALQAPTGSNRQTWHFVVLTEEGPRRAIAELYQRAWATYGQRTRPEYPADDPRGAAMARVLDSAGYLADHMHEVPALVVPCIEGRPEDLPIAQQASLWGSILPGVWSFMLAARSRGLGTAWTTIHLVHEEEAREALGIPESWLQAALIPVAHYTGESFKPAPRLPVEQVTSWNRWGSGL